MKFLNVYSGEYYTFEKETTFFKKKKKKKKKTTCSKPWETSQQ